MLISDCLMQALNLTTSVGFDYVKHGSSTAPNCNRSSRSVLSLRAQHTKLTRVLRRVTSPIFSDAQKTPGGSCVWMNISNQKCIARPCSVVLSSWIYDRLPG